MKINNPQAENHEWMVIHEKLPLYQSDSCSELIVILVDNFQKAKEGMDKFSHSLLVNKLMACLLFGFPFLPPFYILHKSDWKGRAEEQVRATSLDRPLPIFGIPNNLK